MLISPWRVTYYSRKSSHSAALHTQHQASCQKPKYWWTIQAQKLVDEAAFCYQSWSRYRFLLFFVEVFSDKTFILWKYCRKLTFFNLAAGLDRQNKSLTEQFLQTKVKINTRQADIKIFFVAFSCRASKLSNQPLQIPHHFLWPILSNKKAHSCSEVNWLCSQWETMRAGLNPMF